MALRPELIKVEETRAAIEELRALSTTATLTGPSRKALLGSISDMQELLDLLTRELDPVALPESFFDPTEPRLIGHFVALALIAQDRRPLPPACSALEISDRTLRRWAKDGQLHVDQRPLVPRPDPANKLSAAERAAVLEACNSKEFSSLPPSQIVPKLADQGRYLASESSFYRMPHARMVSSITVAGPSRLSGANHPPAIRPAGPARSGPGTSRGCPGRWQACSSIST